MLGDFTTYKVKETGKWIVFVDSKDTSQTCSKCHQKSLIKQELNDRIFTCAFCKNELDRDINSLKLHSKYHKQIKIRRKIHAHNDKLQLKEGDEVKIISSPPFSKTKKFMVVSKKTK